jgi:hypothetical protein
VKALRFVGLALLLSLLFGMLIGTAIRLRLEKPVVYIGQHGSITAALETG